MIKIRTVHGKPLTPEEQRKRLGLGDAVAIVAQPIAKVVDFVAGTNLRDCAPCTGPGGRKDRWNEMVPDLLNPFRKE